MALRSFFPWSTSWSCGCLASFASYTRGLFMQRGQTSNSFRKFRFDRPIGLGLGTEKINQRSPRAGLRPFWSSTLGGPPTMPPGNDRAQMRFKETSPFFPLDLLFSPWPSATLMIRLVLPLSYEHRLNKICWRKVSIDIPSQPRSLLLPRFSFSPRYGRHLS